MNVNGSPAARRWIHATFYSIKVVDVRYSTAAFFVASVGRHAENIPNLYSRAATHEDHSSRAG